MNNWREVKLGDVSENISRGISPKYVDNGIIVLNQKCIRDFSIDFKVARFTSKDKKYPEYKFLRYGDILINSTGTGTLGRVSIYLESNPILVDSHITIVRLKDEVEPKFLANYLHLIEEVIIRMGRGATNQQELNKSVLEKMKFRFPGLKTQERIADILSTYDELIENNNRRIEILEKIAEEIYKEWFVRMRFPGYENTKFIKGIPEGWEVKRVGDLLNRLQAGHFYKEDELLEEGEVIVIDQSTKKYMGFHNEKPTHIADIDNPIILFGDHSCKMLVMTRKFSLGENVVPFISVNKHPVLFLYYSLKGLIQTEEYKRHWKELINKKIFYPQIWLQEKFRDTIKDNINLIEKHKEQNQNLIKQRDLLLPRLMNGTIEVK